MESGGLCCPVDCRVLDGCEAAESPLATAPVIGPLDPGFDRQLQLLPAGPALAVQDVLLQQGEEGLRRGIVAAPTRPIDPVTL